MTLGVDETVSCAARHVFFFFNDTATTEIYTLSLHDALPISCAGGGGGHAASAADAGSDEACAGCQARRSEEHTSELQSHLNLVCRLLLEKKKSSKPRTINASGGRTEELQRTSPIGDRARCVG